MNGGDTGKVFVGEYRVEAVRGEAGDLAGLRLHLDANILLKLLTDPAEPARTTLELVGVDGARVATARVFTSPERLVARGALGLAALGLAALVWVIVGTFSSRDRAVDWQAQAEPAAISTPRVTLPAATATHAAPVVETPATDSPLVPPLPSAPIRLVPEPTAPPTRPALALQSAPAASARAAPRAPKANPPTRQVPISPATSAASASSAPIAAAAGVNQPSANVLDLFNDTK